MASTLSHRRPAGQSMQADPRHRRRRGRGGRQAVAFVVQVAAALLAIVAVTSLTAAVPEAVRAPRADEIVPPSHDLPPVAAAAYVVLDSDTGEPLASYNADQPRPVASLTKLMTARLVLDAGHLDHTAIVPSLRIAGDESK